MTGTCRCGHVERIHNALDGTECRACVCPAFTPAQTAQDAMNATEAARLVAVARERAYGDLRRAVANYRLSEARNIIDRLQEDR